MVALLILAMFGLTLVHLAPRGSVAELVGGVLTIAPLMAIPVGYAMGYLG